MVGHHLFVGPHFVGAVLLQLEQQRAGVVACREVCEVADDEWRRGIDRGIDAGPPAFLVQHVASLRIEDDRAGAREEDGQARAVHGANHGRRVAGRIAGRTPGFLAAGQIEGDDARLRTANVDEDEVVVNDRRRADAEVAGWRLVFLRHQARPDLLSVRERQAMERPLGAKRDELVAGDHWRRARAVPFAELVLIGGRIRELPRRFACGRTQAFDDFLIADAMEEDQAIARDDRPAVAFADVTLPNDGGARFREGVDQPLFERGAVAARAEELRPIIGAGVGNG